jgi:hypothetical protein
MEGSWPVIGPVPELHALSLYDAEPLPGWRFHHDPAIHALCDACAVLLQATHLGFDVIGFDVQVHPAWMGNGLHLDVKLLTGIDQAYVFFSLLAWQRTGFHSQCGAPETGSALQIAGLAVDYETGKSAPVHSRFLLEAAMASDWGDHLL